MSKLVKTPELTALLRQAGDYDKPKAFAGQNEFATTLAEVIREGIMDGNILGGVFEPVPLDGNSTPEFDLHWLAPGTEKEFVAYTIPNHGQIPQRRVEGDYVILPRYDIAGAIDILLKHLRSARYDMASQLVSNLEQQFVVKMNEDGWHVVLAAGVDRNIVVYDSDAAVGQFTKRLVSLMKTVMRRNGGGNSTSTNRSILTDLFTSPEAQEDMRNWGVDQVDEVTRREIYVAGDGTLNRIFNVNLHDLDELGVGQDFQNFYADELNGTMPGGDVEIAVGLDLRNRASTFVMPISEEGVQIYTDETVHRAGLAAWYGRLLDLGFGVLDSRKVILGSF